MFSVKFFAILTFLLFFTTCTTQLMTRCAVGFGQSVAGTATSDTQCEACVAATDDTDRIGSFSTSIGYVNQS